MKSSAARVSARETARLIASDFKRLVVVHNVSPSFFQKLFWILSPNIIALFLYRWSHWAHCKGWSFISWPLYLLNYYVTKADITPITVIGEGCVVGHVCGTVLCGRIGRNCTFWAAPGIGGGIRREDIGGGAGLPLIGDDVMVGARATILGPIRIGDRAAIGPMALVLKDIPVDGTASARPASVASKDPEIVTNKNV